MELTLRWLVEDSGLKNLRCLTRGDDLNRTFESVNILDNPDVLKWIKKNELVLTTGYIFRDDPALQYTILHELKKIGCAALCIKIKRFFEEIPASIVAEAMQIGLPIIELPFFYPFSDISACIYQELHAREHLEEERLMHFQLDASELFLEEDAVARLLKLAAGTLSRALFLVDSAYSPLGYAVPPGHPLAASELEPGVKIQPLEASGAGLQRFNIAQYIGHFLVLPFPSFAAELIVEGTEFSPLELAALGFLRNLLALRYTPQQTLAGVLPHSYNFFLDFLLTKQEKSTEETIALLDFYGFPAAKNRICVLFALGSGDDRLAGELASRARDLSLPASTFICFNEKFLCLFIFPRTAARSLHVLGVARQAARELLEWLAGRGESDVRVGISLAHAELATIKTSFHEALDAIHIGAALFPSERLFMYSEQLPLQRLNRADTGELRALYELCLEPLVDYDRESGDELVRVLHTHFQTGFNVSLTAKRLFIHRNTLTHRLDKIRELLGVELADYRERELIYESLCAYLLLTRVRRLQL